MTETGKYIIYGIFPVITEISLKKRIKSPEKVDTYKKRFGGYFMLSATVLFVITTFFAALLLIFVREPLSLALFFSSGNALIVALAGLSIVRSAAVLIGSFGIFLTAIAITSLVLKILEKRANVKNAQK